VKYSTKGRIRFRSSFLFFSFITNKEINWLVLKKVVLQTSTPHEQQHLHQRKNVNSENVANPKNFHLQYLLPTTSLSATLTVTAVEFRWMPSHVYKDVEISAVLAEPLLNFCTFCCSRNWCCSGLLATPALIMWLYASPRFRYALRL
jgi:hypothetical protein